MRVDALVRSAIFPYTKNMAQSTVKRKRGRPATGTDHVLTVRIPEATIDIIDRWAKREGITRGAAVRRIIEVGLRRRGKDS